MGMTEEDVVHRHERSDVQARWPVLIGVVVGLFLPFTVALVALLMNTLFAPQPATPKIFAQEPRAANVPRLQVYPQADLAEVRAQWQRRLNGYGWIDRAHGIVHIPIDAAMQRLAQQGLSKSGQSPLKAKPSSGTHTGQSERTLTQPGEHSDG